MSELINSFIERASKLNKTIVLPEGEEDRIVSYGRDGTKSEGYLIRRGEGGEECKLIRKDKYLAVADVVERVKGE